MPTAKLITCVLPKGKALHLQAGLIDEKNIHTAIIHHGRGVGRFAPLAERGIGEQREKEIVDIVVTPDEADDIFEYVFYRAGLNEPHGGIVYMTQLMNRSEFTLPELPKEQT